MARETGTVVFLQMDPTGQFENEFEIPYTIYPGEAPTYYGANICDGADASVDLDLPAGLVLTPAEVTGLKITAIESHEWSE